MLPKDEDIVRSFAEGLTQSEIMERCNCPRKHLFRYMLNLKRQGSFSWALTTGGAVHRLLEEHYNLLKATGKGLNEFKVIDFDFEPDVVLTPEQYEEYKYWKIIAGLLVFRHNCYYQETDSKIVIQEIEVPVDLEYEGFRLRGVIDLVATDKTRGSRPWIMDHKTASDLSEIKLEGFSFRFQFLFYSWLWRKLSGERPSGTYVNILKKPRERILKNESLETFLKRIDINVQLEYPKYFNRPWIPLDDDILDRFERYTLRPALNQFRLVQMALNGEFNQELKESILLMPNTDHCISWNVVCEYISLCKENFKDFAMEYIKREEKHMELKRFNVS